MKNEQDNTKLLRKIIIFVLLLPPFIIVAGCSYLIYAAHKPFSDYCYVTTEVAEYMDFSGNYAGGYAAIATSSFFPQKLEEYFSDVTYSFRAENFDHYGYEVYLEFTIEDASAFGQYVAAIAEPDSWNPFAHDLDFMEYTLADELQLHPYAEDGSTLEYPHIERADIKKVLYSPSEQKIIYIALGVHDGGGVTTEFLCKYLERFQIDPVQYATTIYE